ncbi:L-rhamnose mutarotase [Pelagicoccus enzymogenes]|uniref:L-rhamnose mutarotase n=1 Tax=Pelagicoccus enzymogenes TaxID=2773457 RepID=UPI0031F2DDF0
MRLKPGAGSEYKRRHDEIWPELLEALRSAGVLEFSIFLDEGSSTLFAFRKLSESNSVASLAHCAVVQKWWAYMADLMEVNPNKIRQ